VLQALIDGFAEKQGRQPTEEEVKMWVDTIREANEEAAVKGFGGAPQTAAVREVDGAE
jgi:hypothetical protein